MRMVLRLSNRLSAVLKSHHRRVARREITKQVAPEPGNSKYFVDGELRKSAIMITMINNNIGLTNRWNQRWKIIGMKPDLRIWSNTSLRDIGTKRATIRAFTATHAMGS